MKKLFMLIIGFLMLSMAGVVHASDEKPWKIGILMWHETDHDEAALRGFKAGIELSGIPHTFDLQRAYSNEEKAKAFIRTWNNEKIDLICTIGTKATLWALEKATDIPIVFTSVTDPVTSGIANSWESQGRNVTGSSNWIDGKHKLKIFKEGIPHLKTLGVIYNPKNPVPVVEVEYARKQAQELGITLKEATIENVDQIENAISKLISQGIDALWVPIEVLVYHNMERVGRITQAAKLPVVSSSLEGIEVLAQGESVGMISVTVDYEALGRLCVPAVIEILTTGKDPKDIPITTLEHQRIIINANAADAIGYQIPPTFLAKASQVIRGFSGQKIIVGGTGDSQHLLSEIAKALEERLGGGEIEVPESIGSGGGIRAVAAGKIDLARVARPLKENETKLGLTYKCFAKSPVVFVIHPSVTGIEDLKSEDIIGIYSGKINVWGQLGGQDQKIYAITREVGDSCRIVLNKRIPGFKDITEPTAKVIYNTPEAVATLIRHKKTIGFLPMPMTIGKDLKILTVDGVYPSAENIRSGRYKLVVPFGIVYKGELKGLAQRFVNFLSSTEGKRLIAEYGAVPE
ncbi:MAG: substrate-binding domain-containing protein [Proteobacteria bacterium]|nr:substrate-binding domain-containing protein [Pseudomonadota bacterium]MBU1057918.1 substrate-binding domain-containing protein [Pseudomonadota bacterium]